MRCLHNSLSINALINIIKDNFKIQKYIANSKGENAKRKFDDEWNKWDRLVML